MLKSEIVEAIACFDRALAESLRPEYRRDEEIGNAVVMVAARLFARDIRAPEEPAAVIRRAVLMIEQVGGSRRFKVEDPVRDARIAEKAALKAKSREAYLKVTTTPVLSDEEKEAALSTRFRPNRLIGMLVSWDSVLDRPHKPCLWGLADESSVKRAIVTMIRNRILDVVEHNELPQYTTVQQGPRWEEAVAFYAHPHRRPPADGKAPSGTAHDQGPAPLKV
jgi:hypothetical protein